VCEKFGLGDNKDDNRSMGRFQKCGEKTGERVSDSKQNDWAPPPPPPRPLLKAVLQQRQADARMTIDNQVMLHIV